MSGGARVVTEEGHVRTWSGTRVLPDIWLLRPPFQKQIAPVSVQDVTQSLSGHLHTYSCYPGGSCPPVSKLGNVSVSGCSDPPSV